MQTVNEVDSALNQQAKERSCAKKSLALPVSNCDACILFSCNRVTNTLPLCPAHLSLYFAKPAIDLTSFFPALGTTVSKPCLPCAAKQGLNKHSLLSTPLNQPLISRWKTPFQTVYYQKWTSEMCGENLRWFSVKRFLTQTSTTKLSWSCSWTWCSQSIWYQALLCSVTWLFFLK